MTKKIIERFCRWSLKFLAWHGLPDLSWKEKESGPDLKLERAGSASRVGAQVLSKRLFFFEMPHCLVNSCPTYSKAGQCSCQSESTGTTANPTINT